MAKQQKQSAESAGSRVRNLSKKQVKAKAKTEARTRSSPPNSFHLTWQVLGTLQRFWKPLGGIMLVYLILNIIFASGFSNLSSEVSSIKANLSTSSSSTGPLSSGVGGFLSLLANGGAGSSPTGAVLQTILVILQSLVIIWALRNLLAGKHIAVKQAYYRSMTPLIPFLLVILFILLQLLPIGFGSAIVGAILSSLVSSIGLLVVVLGAILLLLAAWSLYMVSGSIFALYIVTLPDMQPRQALRSAKNLVHYRRFVILRRVLFLPIFLLLVLAILVVPLILYATFLVAPVFYILSLLVLLFVHTYLYSLYRSLLA